MADGTTHTPEPAADEVYDEGAYVVEERRGSRIARVIYAWDDPPPALYKLAGPHGGEPWMAWKRHLRRATDDEIAAYCEAEAAVARRVERLR